MENISVDFLDGRVFNLLTLMLTVFGLLLALVSVYLARKALFPPKRQVAYLLESASPFTSRAVHFQVSYNGVALHRPYVAVLRLENTGRHAVSSEHYDQGRPIELDLGAQIVDVTSFECDPPGYEAGSYHVIGQKISFGPELINRGQCISFTVVTDGRPQLVLRHHLIDTKIREGGGSRRFSAAQQQLLVAVAVSVIGALATALASALGDSLLNK